MLVKFTISHTNEPQMRGRDKSSVNHSERYKIFQAVKSYLFGKTAIFSSLFGTTFVEIFTKCDGIFLICVY